MAKFSLDIMVPDNGDEIQIVTQALDQVRELFIKGYTSCTTTHKLDDVEVSIMFSLKTNETKRKRKRRKKVTKTPPVSDDSQVQMSLPV